MQIASSVKLERISIRPSHQQRFGEEERTECSEDGRPEECVRTGGIFVAVRRWAREASRVLNRVPR